MKYKHFKQALLFKVGSGLNFRKRGSPLGVSPDCKSVGTPSELVLLETPYALKGQKLLAKGNTLG